MMKRIFAALFVLMALLPSNRLNAQSFTGQDFWLTLPENDGGNPVYYIYVVSQFGIDNATIELPFYNRTETFSVEPGEFYSIAVPMTDFNTGDEAYHVNSGGVENKGVHITSPKPITVYVLNYARNSSDGETILPTSELGTEYVLGFRANTGTVKTTVVATEDNTSIKVNLWGNFSVGGFPTTDQLLLNKGQTYMVETRYDYSSDYLSILDCNGVTGATITSDKKIAVFGSSNCGTIGATERCDAMMVTYLPVNKWSQSYTTAQIIERGKKVDISQDGLSNNGVEGSGDYIEVVGKIGTNITVNRLGGSTNFTIQTLQQFSGDHGYGYVIFEKPEVDQNGEANFRITADQPIQVMQYTKGRGVDNNQFADPESFNNFPETYWKDSYFFYPIFTPSFDILGDPNSQKLAVTIIVNDNTLPLASESIELNDINVNTINPNPWISIDGTSYKYKRVQPEFISSKIRSNNGSKFGFFFYPVSERESAIFSGGYGPLDNVSLKEQFADIDILSTGNFCLDTEVAFEPRIYTFTLPPNVSYLWKFGDGQTSTERNPVHSYSSLGKFTVELEIFDGSGFTVKTARNVTINDVKVDINPASMDLCLGESVTLTGTPTLRPSGSVLVKYANTTITEIPDISIRETWNGRSGTPATSVITIPEDYDTWTLDSVCLNIRHSKVRDVQISLESPCGSTLILAKEQNTKGRANYRKTCFSISSGTSIDQVLAPFTGNFVPKSGAVGWPSACNPKGNWTLRVGDDSVFVKGQLIDWSIFFTTQNKPTKYEWTDGASLNRDDSSTVIATPNQSTAYVLTVTDFTQCQGKDTVMIKVERRDAFPTVQDSIICNTVDSINLFSAVLGTYPTTGQWVANSANVPANRLRGSYFVSKDLAAGLYSFKYLVSNNPLRCGFDSAVVNLRINAEPKLGLPGDTALCNTSQVTDMTNLLKGTPDLDGYFSLDGNVVSKFFNPATSIPGNYTFYYKKDVVACSRDSVAVTIDLNRQSIAGTGRDTTLCETKVPLQLGNLLSGSDLDGVWESDAILPDGAFFAGGIFVSFGLPAGTYTFRYVLTPDQPCKRVEAVVKVNVQAAPKVDLTTITPKLCIDSTATVNINIVGTGPFNFTISDGVKDSVYTNILTTASFKAPVTTNTLYVMTRILDSSTPKCLVNNADSILIEVFQPIRATLVKEFCPSGISSPEFIARVEIQGGDSTTYSADVFARNNNTGVTFTQSGIGFTNALFSSPLLPNGANYTIRFSDGTNCSIDSIVDKKFCECESEAQGMDLNPLSICEDDSAFAIVTGNPPGFQELVDPTSIDTLVFVLHTKGGIALGDVLAASRRPVFGFDKNTMQYGKTYYISQVVGDLGAYFGFSYDNVNMTAIDTCLDISRGTPVVFNQKPSLVITGNAEICQGVSTPVNFNFTSGKAPFTVVLNDGTQDTTLLIDAQNKTIDFTPLSSVNYTLVRITDANACDTMQNNQGFNIIVNELPTAKISGDATICEGSTALLPIDLTGNGPWQITYSINDVVQPTLTAAISPFQLNAGLQGAYKLTGLIDSKCPGVPDNKPVTIKVSKPPVANAGLDQALCGLSTQLKAIPSFGIGTWSDPGGMARFSNLNDSFAAAIVPNRGTYTLVWSENNVPCPISRDTMMVVFTDQPVAFAGNDTNVCGLTYQLKAVKSKGVGNWQYLGNQELEIVNADQVNAIVNVKETGSYTLVWRESVDDICSDADTVLITFNKEITAIVKDTICNNTATGYQLVVEVSGGNPGTYLLNGLPVSNTFTSGFIPNGIAGKLLISDKSNCDTDTINTNYTCPCISRSGTVGQDTIKVCDDAPVIIPENFDFVLDANDTLIYVLHTNPNDILGNVLASSSLNRFTRPASANYNQVYYGSVVVANKQAGGTGFNVGDRCIAVSPGTPIIFKSPTFISIPSPLIFCEGQAVNIPVNITDNNTYNITYLQNGVRRTSVVTGPSGLITINPIVGKNTIIIEEAFTTNPEACTQLKSFLVEIMVNPKPSIELKFKDTLCVNETTSIFNTPSNVSTVIWDLGNDTQTSASTPKVSYDSAGSYTIKAILVSDKNCKDTLVFTNRIKVAAYPNADFTINDKDTIAELCLPSTILLEAKSSNYVSNTWFVNGQVIINNSASISNNQQLRGNYDYRHEATGLYACKSTSSKLIKGLRPEATLSIENQVVCNGDFIKFNALNMVDSDSSFVVFSSAFKSDTIFNKSNGSYKVDVPFAITQLAVKLQLLNQLGCKYDTTINVNISQLSADFLINNQGQDTVKVCFNVSDPRFLVDNSINAQSWNWNFGNGITSNQQFPPQQTYNQVGIYPIKLSVKDASGKCVSSKTKYIQVVPLPNVAISPRFDTVCVNTNNLFYLSGANTYSLDSTNFIKLDNSTTVATVNPDLPSIADTSLTFSITGTDQNGCIAKVAFSVYVSDLKNPKISRDPFLIDPDGIYVMTDTAITVGDTVYFSLPDDERYSWSWFPLIGAQCDNCSEQALSPKQSQSYDLTFRDKLGCYSQNISGIRINVEDRFTIDMPDAFTPDGNGENEVIYPDGLGIRRIQSFEIYSKTGVLLHSASGTADPSIGWDGKYKGKLQIANTYYYKVIAIPYGKTKPVIKSGQFNLIR